MSRSTMRTTLVIELDVTRSLKTEFRLAARNAIADALPRLIHGDHGAVDIYVRKIDHSSGNDEAAVLSIHLDGVHVCSAGNPFDQKCRNAHKRSLRVARRQLWAARRKIRALRLPQAKAGTVIRGGLAVAGEILASTPGDKWLIVASDMRPSHAHTPRPTIALNGVHVVILFACRQPVAICQIRQSRWSKELERDGAIHPVKFLAAQQMDELFEVM